MSTVLRRRLPVGAEAVRGSGSHFRVWAPRSQTVELILERVGTFPLERDSEGYFSGLVEAATPGSLYRYRLDAKQTFFPDPASRFQPDGPHGPSQIVDASDFAWTDDHWPGVQMHGQVVYEIHIGTFTSEGTWQAAERHLADLRDLGITLIEVMPIAEFPGSFGWGYDGVDLFAPYHVYGKPDDVRSFINAAHAHGMGVILDVVYNHIGPAGNYLKEFSETYFTERYKNEWGEAINFDGEGSGPVREFFISNAGYWIEEYHFDGLRLDATQQLFDASSRNIIQDIVTESRARAEGRSIVIIGENEPQDSRLIREYGVDALWNDDFHHDAHVALTGRKEAYYTDYNGTPQEFISALKWGFLYQGQHYSWQKARRGTPSLDLSADARVIYIQNHDQIANSIRGERIHTLTSPGRFRTVTALMLLAPATPMLFQGQEFCASSPFLYFADHNPELAAMVERGRLEFLSQFDSIANCVSQLLLPLPHDRSTFERCRLDQTEREQNLQATALHRDLLTLRRQDRVLRAQRSDWMHGAVLGNETFVLRFLGGTQGDRLLVINLGKDLLLSPAPEPLLAPPPESRWSELWSSEDPRYGGCARPPVDEEGRWTIAGESAVVLST